MKTKKILSALTALLLTASMLTSCGDNAAEEPSSAAETKETTVTTTAEQKETEAPAESKEPETTESAPDEDSGMVEVDIDGEGVVDNMEVTDIGSLNRLSTTPKASAGGSKMQAGAAAKKWADKKPEAKKKLTLMVYMVGSDLESEAKSATMDLIEMLDSGLDDKDINLVIYCGGAKTWWIPNFPTGSNAYLEYKSEGADLTTEKGKGGVNIYTADKKNMAEADTFTQFLKEVPTNYPADEYALICWDHGGGPVMGYGADEINIDPKTGMPDFLTLDEMKSSLDKSQFKNDKLKFIGFDACIMSSLEVADMWKDYADYMIASADVEPGPGWNYEFLGSLKADEKADAVGKEVVNQYFAFFKEMPTSAPSLTLATMDLSKTDGVKDAVGGLCKAMLTDVEKGDMSKYMTMLDGVHTYGQADLADLGTVVNSLSKDYSSETGKLKDALNDMIVNGSTTIKNSSGISLYFPMTNPSADYQSSQMYFALGGVDLITNDAFNDDYKKLMNTLFEFDGKTNDNNSSKPESSSSKTENTSSKTESTSSKTENSSSEKEESSSKKESSSSSKAESSSSKTDTSSEKPDTSSKTDDTSSKSETSSKAEDSSSKTDTSSSSGSDSSKPENVNPLFSKLDLEVVQKGTKPSDTAFKDEGFAYSKLTDEQMKNVIAVNYTVFEKDSNLDFYRPVMLAEPAKIGKDGVIKMDIDPYLVAVQTDRDAEPMVVRTKNLGGGDYRTIASLWADSDISDETMYIDISTHLNSKGELQMLGMTATEDDTNGPSAMIKKEDIDLSEWMSLADVFTGFKLDADKDCRKSYTELERSFFGANYSGVGENFTMTAMKISDFVGVDKKEYAIQMSVFTRDGKECCSPIRVFEYDNTSKDKSKRSKVELENGTLEFAVYDDHAELISYTTKDKEKDGKVEVPEKVDGKSVTVIRNDSFKNTSPTELIFPDTVEVMNTINAGSFSKLTKVKLPKKLKYIPERMFSYTTTLESVELPEELEGIGYFAFDHTGLKEINIPKKVSNIDPGAFRDCSALDKITVDKDNNYYVAEDNVLYTHDKKKLVAFTGTSRSEFTIPEGVTEIAAYAFVGSYDGGMALFSDGEAKGLTKITFPKSLTTIRDFAFENCTGFKEIVLPDNLEYIGSCAFGLDTFSMSSASVELPELKIGPKVSRIRTLAFKGYKIKKLTVDSKNSFFKADGNKLKSIDGSREIPLTESK